MSAEEDAERLAKALLHFIADIETRCPKCYGAGKSGGSFGEVMVCRECDGTGSVLTSKGSLLLILHGFFERCDARIKFRRSAK